VETHDAIMLAPTSERIEDALGRLSPDDGALLELSLRRGVSDDDIAALLHVHREHVEQLREQALERLNEHVGADSRAEVAAMVGQSSRANGETPLNLSEPKSPTRGRRVTDYPPSLEARRRARRRAGLLAAAALAAGAVALVLALSAGGGGKEPTLGPDPNPPAPAPQAAAPRVALAPVTANGASGSAQLSGSRLQLRISGLTAGSYAVWLFDDVSDAKQIAHFNGSGAALGVSLPKGFQSHRFIDVSREPADGNPNHSGDSVLRAPLAKLLPH
jgi:hypothetical protein